MIRIEGLAGTGPGHLASCPGRPGRGSGRSRSSCRLRTSRQSAELAYAGNVHVAQGRTVDAGHTVIEAGASRSLAYTGGTRGREKNTFHVVTGAPDPAQPSRAEREAYTAAAIRQRAELRRKGDTDAARAIPLVMPDRPSDRQLAPWEAVMAQVLQQDEPERTALEEMQAAQDYATNTGHLLELSEAYWRLDVVPQIDEMIRQRVSPREYERYRQDPERPALLQALREHEIGGRRIEDSLDAITADPMTGLRSIAAGLHGRLGKEPAPARGETRNWAERAPQNAPEPIREATRMLDARQAELGRQLAERPPQWTLEAWGVPPAEPGALREDWERRAGIVESYREAAGITDPAQAIGPVPTGQAQLREAFHPLSSPWSCPTIRPCCGPWGAASSRRRWPRTTGPRRWPRGMSRPRSASASGTWKPRRTAPSAPGTPWTPRRPPRPTPTPRTPPRTWPGSPSPTRPAGNGPKAHAGQAQAAREAEGELRRRDQAERVAQADEPRRNNR